MKNPDKSEFVEDLIKTLTVSNHAIIIKLPKLLFSQITRITSRNYNSFINFTNRRGHIYHS